MVFAWGYFDTYKEFWKNDRVNYIDTYHRWTGRHIYRYISAYETGDSTKLSWTADGQLAGTGKLHGKWDYTYWSPNFTHHVQFYWYGEEVTEGEWHLRN